MAVKPQMDALTEVTLNTFGRTKQVGTSTRNAAGNTRLVYATTAGVFRDTQTCLEDVVYQSNVLTADERKQMKGYFSLFKYLEPKYECSGLCNPALFWYTLDLADYPVPTERCIVNLK